MSEHLQCDLLDRYFDGACSPVEAEAIAQWAASRPEHEEELGRLRRAWELGAGPQRYDVNAAWGVLRRRVKRSQPLDTPGPVLRIVPPSTRRRVPWRRWPIAIAAAIVMAVIADGVWRQFRTGSNETKQNRDTPTKEYATARGQRAEILLADGTQVLLSVDSRLRVPATYGLTTRDVYLEGEAFFDVQHDTQHPFRVRTAHAVAEDVGTTFVVRSYAEAMPVVVVASGHVALHATAAPHAGPIMLGPGQLGNVDEAGQLSIVGNVNVDGFLGWTRGHIELHKVTLAQAARELERWYDVNISIADTTLARTKLSASFENQSLTDVLDIISRTLGIQYRRQGTQVHLSTDTAVQ